MLRNVADVSDKDHEQQTRSASVSFETEYSVASLRPQVHLGVNMSD